MTDIVDENWPVSLTRAQGKRIRARRLELDLKPAEVVERLASQGLHMNRSTYVNLELGRRKAITVPEFFALAFVLDIAPALLMVPLAHDQTLEVVAGEHVGSWVAYKWLIGSGALIEHDPFAGARAGEEERRFSAAVRENQVIQWHRFNDDLAHQVIVLDDQLKNESIDAGERESLINDRTLKIAQLRHWRQQITDAGLLAPPLNSRIRHNHPEIPDGTTAADAEAMERTDDSDWLHSDG